MSGEIREGDMSLEFVVHGGSIESAGPDGPYGYFIEGTVRPGETVSIAASATSIGADPASQNTPQAASFDIFLDNDDVNEREHMTLEPGEGGSLASSVVVPANAWRVNGTAIIGQTFWNPHGGGSRTLTMRLELEVVAESATTTTRPSGGSSGTFPWPEPPEDEDCEVPDDYWDPKAGHVSIVRFGGLHGEVNVRPNCADDDAYIFAELTTPLHHDDRIRTLTRSGAILSFSDMSTYVMPEDTTIVLDIAIEGESKFALVAGRVLVNLQRMLEDGSMEVEMGQAVLGVKGTVFVAEEADGQSIIKVFEGTVEVRPHAGGLVEVGPGQMVATGADGAEEVTAFDVDAELARWGDDVREVGLEPPAGKSGGAATRVVLIALAVVAVVGAAYMVMTRRQRHPIESF